MDRRYTEEDRKQLLRGIGAGLLIMLGVFGIPLAIIFGGRASADVIVVYALLVMAAIFMMEG